MWEMLLLRIIEVLQQPFFIPIAALLAIILVVTKFSLEHSAKKPCLVVENITYKYINTQEKENDTIIHLVVSYYIRNKSQKDNTILNAFYYLGDSCHKHEYLIYPGGFHIDGRACERIDAGVILFHMGTAPIAKQYPLKVSITDENSAIYSDTTTVTLPQ